MSGIYIGYAATRVPPNALLSMLQLDLEGGGRVFKPAANFEQLTKHAGTTASSNGQSPISNTIQVPVALRTPYAMSGTDLAYGAARYRAQPTEGCSVQVVPLAISLHACYAYSSVLV
eukprot:2266677-Rhodomonas_salina.1